MSVAEVTYYTVVCDEPGCDEDAFALDDWTAWKQPEGAIETFEASKGDSDWQSTDDGKHFCPVHRTWDEDA